MHADLAKVIYLGHSCFTIEIDGVKLLVDPFVTPNPKAASIDIKALEADVILVTHAHQDHIADLMFLAKQTKAVVVSNYEMSIWVEKQGYTKTKGMNYGGKYVHNGLIIKAVHAVHSSSFVDGSYGGNPLGFVITGSDYCMYYAGDTALHMDMNLLGAFYKIDLAFLPIGDTYTMDYEDAVQAADFVGCKRVIGMHYDTFPVIEIDKEAAKTYFKKHATELILMSIGEEQTFKR